MGIMQVLLIVLLALTFIAAFICAPLWLVKLTDNESDYSQKTEAEKQEIEIRSQHFFSIVVGVILLGLVIGGLYTDKVFVPKFGLVDRQEELELYQSSMFIYSILSLCLLVSGVSGRRTSNT